MHKVWITTREGIPGKYVEWYDQNMRRRSKYFSPHNQKYISIFKARKFSELNADVRPIGSVVDITWERLKEKYFEQKEADKTAENTRKDIKNTIRLFETICAPVSTAQITLEMVNKFKKDVKSAKNWHLVEKQEKELKDLTPEERKAKAKSYKTSPLSPHTLNKHLRNLRALFDFALEGKHIVPVKISDVKTQEKPIRFCVNEEIKNLIIACGTDAQWRMRILMAVCTGLRRSDLDSLQLAHINIEHKYINSVLNIKTGKITYKQPLPDELMPELLKFINEEIAEGQVRLFKYKFSKKWETIRHKAGLDDIDFHDLRRTFGTLQAQAGVPIKALQQMLNHADIETTMRSYIGTDEPTKRAGVNKLQVGKWL